MTTTTPLESGCMLAASKTDKRSSLLDWPQLVGLRELDLGTDKLPPLHWLAHPFPAELEVIPDNIPPDVITIIHQSLSFDLYRKSALPSQDGGSDAHQNGSLISNSQCRQRKGSISQLSRLSSLNNSEGSRSPSKRSVDSGSIRRPLVWIGSKKSNPTRALRDRLRERNTFK
ncbi:hypothetical protein I7I51_02992 [Histoplasma capsulatum]|uniref:Uncharacterized protein n=1 Tax=Ajellomyces capsulatus TaxID=5037 RepID=A0A8A1MKY2_AJECA|nr:hypothetical protein I7I51_02992 [Histoplasma capsulatum]